MTPRILLVPGSLRAGAFSTALLSAAGRLIPDSFEVVTLDLLRELPHYDPDLEADPPPVVRELRAEIERAAGVLISTPEYNASVPGAVKDFVDWGTRPFGAHPLTGKPVAVIGSSPSSRGGVAAVNWLRMVLGFLGPQLVGDVVTIANVAGEIDDDGTVSEAVTAQLQDTVDALLAAATAVTPAAE